MNARTSKSHQSPVTSVPLAAIEQELFGDSECRAEYAKLEAQYALASQIIGIRAATGLTQREFAERAGIKQPQLARLESGQQLPKIDTLAKLAQVAGLSLEIRYVSPETGRPSQRVQAYRVPATGV